jgi:hypothetical protein
MGGIQHHRWLPLMSYHDDMTQLYPNFFLNQSLQTASQSPEYFLIIRLNTHQSALLPEDIVNELKRIVKIAEE